MEDLFYVAWLLKLIAPVETLRREIQTMEDGGRVVLPESRC